MFLKWGGGGGGGKETICSKTLRVLERYVVPLQDCVRVCARVCGWVRGLVLQTPRNLNFGRALNCVADVQAHPLTASFVKAKC